MKIVVNDIAASTGGALSILINFYKYLKENEKENQWIFLLSDNYFDETDNIKIITMPNIKKSWFQKLIFDFITGKNFINSIKPDVVLSLQNIITFGLKTPQIVYVHQSLPFQSIKNFSIFKNNERKNAIYQHLIGFIIKMSIKKADKVIVQTKWMKKAIYKQTKIPNHKIINIMPDIIDFSEYKNENKFNNTSFFYPSSNNEYKNNNCIYKACKLLNLQNINNFNVKITITNEEKKCNVDFIGRISQKQIIDEYNQSTLIFPSYIETFGLPLAEAKQMGMIVLASDCEFSKEVLEGYENAYFFDPFKPYELAKLMEKVINKKITKISKSDKQTICRVNSWSVLVKEVLNC